MRALITGGTGFAGSYLADLLADEGGEVFVFSCAEPSRWSPGIRHFTVDIRDPVAVRCVCEDTEPDEVYHLAAISSVAASRANPRNTFDVNVGGTYNLLEACRRLASRPRILNVSTSQVYAPTAELRLRESCPVRPENPYAATKAMAELLLWQYPRADRQQIITARPFNHSGPGQTSDFVLSYLAQQVAQMELGLCAPVLRVGDLNVERDFTDVRDVVKAYRILLQRGRGGELYNVCSGTAYRLSSALELLRSLSSVSLRVEIDPDRLHPGEPQRLCGDPTKIAIDTGWRATIPFETTVRDLLEYWRVRSRSETQVVH